MTVGPLVSKNATASNATQKRPGRGGPRRLLIRLQGLWRAVELDEDLAAGVDPVSNDALLWHARRLTEPKQRLTLADSLQRLVSEVERGGPPRLPGPPVIRRDLVKDNRSLLRVVAERLRDDGPHGLRGLAMVDLLVRYGGSPLYRGPSPLQLRRKLLEVLDDLPKDVVNT